MPEEIVIVEDYRKAYLQNVPQNNVYQQTPTDHTEKLLLYAYETKPIQPSSNLCCIDFYKDGSNKEKALVIRKGETVTSNEYGMVKCGMIQNDHFEGNNCTVY